MYGFTALEPAAVGSNVVLAIDSATGRAGTLGAADVSESCGVEDGIGGGVVKDNVVVEEAAAPLARSQGFGGEGIDTRSIRWGWDTKSVDW